MNTCVRVNMATCEWVADGRGDDAFLTWLLVMVSAAAASATLVISTVLVVRTVLLSPGESAAYLQAYWHASMNGGDRRGGGRDRRAFMGRLTFKRSTRHFKEFLGSVWDLRNLRS